MKTSMDDSRLTNVSEIREFLQSTKKLVITADSLEEKYWFIDRTIDRFRYRELSRLDKHTILLYLRKVTGYKRAQLLRLVKRAIAGGLSKKPYHRENPNRVYTLSDIKLLEKTDEFHLRLNSVATREILRREFEIFHHDQYQRLSRISPSHISNLRQRESYRSSWVNGTKSREVPIGETMPPETNDLPGAIRVDTVHQRDVFYLNAVDEITQWEVVVCIPQISERFLEPALEILLEGFPFIVFNFHSDRGSEFINQVVAKLLNKLLIFQTKSRSRHTNDNALVESKNGSVIRKNMGYAYIHQQLVGQINGYLRNFFNPYLDFHRPCLFLTETRKDKHNRERRIYGEATTPYEKLKEILHQSGKNFLKPNISLETLDKIAYEKSDNEFAKMMREEERKLFSKTFFAPKP
jgi:hypothetical protein